MLTLERIQKSFPMFKVEETKLGFRISPDHPQGAIDIEVEPDRFTVFTDDWHGHYDDAREAVWVAYWLLAGRMRTVSEWRGDQFAASYCQFFDGDWAEPNNTSYYLNPFDREEWEATPGDKWMQKIIHRRLLDDLRVFTAGVPEPIPPVGEVLMAEELLELPLILRKNDFSLNWCEQKLGPPQNGLKWSVDNSSGSFFFQIPLGCRCRSRRNLNHKFTEIAPREVGFVIYADAYCRASQHPIRSEVVDGVAHPIETWIERSDELSDGWAKAVLYCRFNDDDVETCGRLQFCWQPDGAREREPIINRIYDAMPHACLWMGEGEPASE